MNIPNRTGRIEVLEYPPVENFFKGMSLYRNIRYITKERQNHLVNPPYGVRYPDLVIVNDTLVVVCEIGREATGLHLEQALEHIGYANYIYIALPAWFAQQALEHPYVKRAGIGVLSLWEGKCYEVRYPIYYDIVNFELQSQVRCPCP